MRFFQTLSRRQREMKITRVATLELATRQVKKSQGKSRQSWNFRDKIAEIVAPVATLQLLARSCNATKEYLANETKVGMSVYSAQVSRSMRFARPLICHKCSHPGAKATQQNLKKIASPARDKNRSCSRGCISLGFFFKCLISLKTSKICHILRTVPTIVIAHTFCASRDTRVSFRWCSLIQGYFCAA